MASIQAARRNSWTPILSQSHVPRIPDFSTNYVGPTIINSLDTHLPDVAISHRLKVHQNSKHQEYTASIKIGENNKRKQGISFAYSTVSEGELGKIRGDAASEKKSRKQELEEERLRLHKKSQDRIKNWDNTILGQRRARLEAQDRRKELAEDEKLRIDEEWQEIRSNERAMTVAKARHQQFLTTPRVRKLTSQLLVSNVMAERDLQTQYGARRAEAERLRDKKEEDLENSEQSVSEVTRMTRGSILAQKNSQRLRRECAARQVEQRKQKKALEAAAKQADRTFYEATNSISIVDSMRGRMIEAESNNDKAEDFKNAVAAIKRDKMEREEIREEEEEQARKDNLRFNQQQEKKEELRKGMAKNRFMDREKRLEQVAQVVNHGRLEEIAKREAAVTQFSKGIFMTDEIKRQALRSKKQEKDLREIETVRQEKIAEKEKRRKNNDATRHSERLRVEREKQEKEEDDFKELLRNRNSELVIKQERQKQMDINASRRKASRDAELAAQLETLRAWNVEDEQFNRYAAALIRQWHEGGKDVGPLMRAMQGEQRSRNYEFQEFVNTYERLGM